MAQKTNYSSTTPAADANSQLLKWKADAPSSDPTVVRNVSVEVPILTASGVGHQAGIVPDPGSVAGITRFLREDASWAAPPSGGGGGSAIAYVSAGAPDAPPATANTMDDEFNGSSLDPKWTRSQTGSIVDSYSLGRLILTSINANGQLMLLQNKPAAPCEFTACYTLDIDNSAAVGNNAVVGICVGDGTKVQALMFGYFPGSTAWQFQIFNFSAFATFSSAPNVQSSTWGPITESQQKIYLRVKDDGTNLIFSASLTGFGFKQIFSFSRTTFLTTGPTKVGLYFVGAPGAVGEFTCDWFRRTDGGYTPGIGGGSIGFSSAASPATLNLSTQGTKDWFIMNGAGMNPPRTAALGSVHSKALGGWIKDSFDWFNGGAGSPTVQAGGSSGISMTSSSSDDIGVALTSSTPNATALGVNSPTPIDFGYKFRVPANLTSRTLKLNVGVNGVKATVTCRMSDGSVADQTTTVDAVSDNTYVQKELTVAFNSGNAMAEMIVEVRVTTNYSTSTHLAAVYFISATLA